MQSWCCKEGSTQVVLPHLPYRQVKISVFLVKDQNSPAVSREAAQSPDSTQGRELSTHKKFNLFRWLHDTVSTTERSSSSSYSNESCSLKILSRFHFQGVRGISMERVPSSIWVKSQIFRNGFHLPLSRPQAFFLVLSCLLAVFLLIHIFINQ